jgi:hypothetical protein
MTHGVKCRPCHAFIYLVAAALWAQRALARGAARGLARGITGRSVLLCYVTYPFMVNGAIVPVRWCQCQCPFLVNAKACSRARVSVNDGSSASASPHAGDDASASASDGANASACANSVQV